LCWVASPQTPGLVLGIGVAISLCSYLIMSSSNQLMATLSPKLTQYTMFGYVSGSATPVIVILLSGFSPASEVLKFQMIVLTVPALCLICIGFLVYVNTYQDIFHETYEVLTALSSRELASQDVAFYDTIPNTRQRSDPGQVPVWVWLWCCYNSFSVCCSIGLLALTAFFGQPSLAQILGLAKLVVDGSGVVAAMPLSHLECFQDGPWHRLLFACGVLRTCLLGVLIAHLGGQRLPETQLLAIWVLFHAIHGVTSPHVAVTVAAFVDVTDRKGVVRVFLFSRECGAVIGLCLAAAVLVPVLNLGNNWPEAGRAIPA